MKPIGNKLLIKLSIPETNTKSGIYVGEQKQQDETLRGVVESVGNGVKQVVAGDMVVVSRFVASDIYPADGDYVLADESDILAILVP